MVLSTMFVLILARKSSYTSSKRQVFKKEEGLYFSKKSNKTKQTVEALSHFTYTTCFKIIPTFE